MKSASRFARLFSRRQSKIENQKAKIAPTRRRPFFESLEGRSLLAGFVGIPNDPGFSQLWRLNNTGQTGGVPDADIDALEAWSATTGSTATVVAILDSGVDYTAPDLYLNMWLNEGEIPASIAPQLSDADADGLITFRDLNAATNSSFVVDININGYIDGGDLLSDPNWENGIDDDGNGLTDDLVGWDFHENDNDPWPTSESHGTDIADGIGAMGNNGLGRSGVIWTVGMIPVRVRSIGGANSDLINANAAAGIDYAVASGASISNNSWRAAGGGYEYSQEIYDAIDRARLAGHLFVTAAGNDNLDNDVTPHFPGSYDLNNIISATATLKTDLKGNTNYGLNSVDLGAPSDGGTSGASAYTTGVAALLKSLHPHWTYTQIKDRILSTVDPLPSLAGKTVSGGRLNAANALGVAQFSVSDAIATEGSSAVVALGQFINSQPSGLIAPTGIAVGPSGDLFVAGRDSNNVLRYDRATGEFLSEFVTAGSGGLASPRQIAFGPDGNLYVAAPFTAEVLRYDGTTGAFIDAFVQAGSGGLNETRGIAFDSAGNMYVASNGTDQILKYQGPAGASPGAFLGVFVNAGAGSDPNYVKFGPDGNLYVSFVNGVATLSDGYVNRYSGTTGAFIDTFVPAGRGGLMNPFDMQFDPEGRLYLMDHNLNAVLRYQGPSGASPGAYIDTYVTPGLAGIASPHGAAFDGQGNLLVASRDTNQVVRFGPASTTAFTINLSSPSSATVTVNFTTAAGTATGGSDFVASSGSITFAPGQTSRTVLIQTVDNTLYEGTETFTVNLSNPTGGVIADAQGVGTILDNDPQPTKFYVVDDGSANKTFEYGSSGSAIENYGLNSGNSTPRGAASTAAGDKVWVVDSNKNVYVYNPSGGLLGSWSAGSLPSNANVQGITTNGTDVWIVDAQGDKVYRYTGAATRTSGSQNAASNFSLNNSNKDATDLVTDGTSIWVLNNTSSTDKVFKYTVGGSLLGSWTISGGGGSPTGLTIDPSGASASIWIVDSSSDRVYEFTSARSRTSGSQSPAGNFALAPGNTNPQGIADPPVATLETAAGSSGASYAEAAEAALLSIVNDLDRLLGVGKSRR